MGSAFRPGAARVFVWCDHALISPVERIDNEGNYGGTYPTVQTFSTRMVQIYIVFDHQQSVDIEKFEHTLDSNSPTPRRKTWWIMGNSPSGNWTQRSSDVIWGRSKYSTRVIPLHQRGASEVVPVSLMSARIENMTSGCHVPRCSLRSTPGRDIVCSACFPWYFEVYLAGYHPPSFLILTITRNALSDHCIGHE